MRMFPTRRGEERILYVTLAWSVPPTDPPSPLRQHSFLQRVDGGRVPCLPCQLESSTLFFPWGLEKLACLVCSLCKKLRRRLNLGKCYSPLCISGAALTLALYCIRACCDAFVFARGSQISPDSALQENTALSDLWLRIVERASHFLISIFQFNESLEPIHFNFQIVHFFHALQPSSVYHSQSLSQSALDVFQRLQPDLDVFTSRVCRNDWRANSLSFSKSDRSLFMLFTAFASLLRSFCRSAVDCTWNLSSSERRLLSKLFFACLNHALWASRQHSFRISPTLLSKSFQASLFPPKTFVRPLQVLVMLPLLLLEFYFQFLHAWLHAHFIFFKFGEYIQLRERFV